jgi:hypothetical protein
LHCICLLLTQSGHQVVRCSRSPRWCSAQHCAIRRCDSAETCAKGHSDEGIEYEIR